MKNQKQTSEHIAQLAGKVLRDPRAPTKTRALAGSALAQARKPPRSTRSTRSAS